MNAGRTVFAQIMDFLPLNEFRKMHRLLRRTAQGSEFFLHGSVSVHGILKVMSMNQPVTTYLKAIEQGKISSKGAEELCRKVGEEGRI